MRMNVYLRSHHYLIRDFDTQALEAIQEWTKTFQQWGLVRVGKKLKRMPIRVFAASNKLKNEYRFHINTLNKFKLHLTGYTTDFSQINFITEPDYEGVVINLESYQDWKPKDYQIPAIEYCVSPSPPRNKLLALQTGQGKSVTCLFALSKISERVCFIIRPAYIEKWLIDIEKQCPLAKEDVVVVQGGASMRALLQMAKENSITAKIILVSNKTYQNYLKAYQNDPVNFLTTEYDVTPDDFFKALGVGVRVIDEAHQDFHINFKLDLFTHVPRSISLTATLTSNDSFIKRMQEIIHPQSLRYQGNAYKRYAIATCYFYHFNKPEKINTKQYGDNRYSHHALEKSVLRHVPTQEHYFDMIEAVFKSDYLDIKTPEERCIIFCSSVEMCTRLSNYLSERYPNLDIRRYVGEDDYDDLMQAQVTVSTLGSAGTAVDIPNLRTTIMTIAITSAVGNEQAFGRLREMKNGNTPHFIYFTCKDIKKHMEYHNEKVNLLRDKALRFNCREHWKYI